MLIWSTGDGMRAQRRQDDSEDAICEKGGEMKERKDDAVRMLFLRSGKLRETQGRGAMAAKWKAGVTGWLVLWRHREREGGGRVV